MSFFGGHCSLQNVVPRCLPLVDFNSGYPCTCIRSQHYSSVPYSYLSVYILSLTGNNNDYDDGDDDDDGNDNGNNNVDDDDDDDYDDDNNDDDDDDDDDDDYADDYDDDGDAGAERW
jgi:hypothetical protein